MHILLARSFIVVRDNVFTDVVIWINGEGHFLIVRLSSVAVNNEARHEYYKQEQISLDPGETPIH